MRIFIEKACVHSDALDCCPSENQSSCRPSRRQERKNFSALSIFLQAKVLALRWAVGLCKVQWLRDVCGQLANYDPLARQG